MQQVQKSSLSQNLESFSHKLYKNLPNNDNLIYSPFNISTAMAMCYAGAQNNTKQQIETALNFNIDNLHQEFASLNQKIFNQKDVTLTTDNRLWPQQGHPFLQDYLKLIQTQYNSDVKQMDFAKSEECRQEINQHVEKATQDKIKDLIPQGSIDGLTKMVITSCIYFKGLWKNQFKKENTKQNDFFLENNNSIKTDFMFQNEKFDFYSDKYLSLLEMPYQGDQFVFGAILPNEGIKTSQIEEQILKDDNTLQKIIKSTHNVKVNVNLPKFKFSFSLSLKEALQKLGMTEAFSDISDFSGMDGQKLLYISDVIHKAFVEVNEEGTEAAAATAVIMKMRCMPAPPQEFNANRPFLFYIRNQITNTFLFFGKVNNPQQ